MDFGRMGLQQLVLLDLTRLQLVNLSLQAFNALLQTRYPLFVVFDFVCGLRRVGGKTRCRCQKKQGKNILSHLVLSIRLFWKR